MTGSDVLSKSVRYDGVADVITVRVGCSHLRKQRLKFSTAQCCVILTIPRCIAIPKSHNTISIDTKHVAKSKLSSLLMLYALLQFSDPVILLLTFIMCTSFCIVC